MKSVLKQLFSLILPLIVLVVIPYILRPGLSIPALADGGPMTVLAFIAGVLLIITGLAGMAVTIRMFILIGKGTLAPWNPTKRLVTGGMYAYVRNPMISSVLLVLLGEALVFWSWEILAWCAVFFVANHVYFIVLEEPGLVRRFGDEYIEYKEHVPRWVPRLKPWKARAK